MTNHKSSFRKLAELTDKVLRKEFDDEPIYYINQARLDNMLCCLESGAYKIKDLESKIENLNLQLRNAEEMVEFYKLNEINND